MSSIPSWAVPGAKVVCVEDRENLYLIPGYQYVGDLDGLKKGTTYTVRSAYVNAMCQTQVRLVEINRKQGYHLDDFTESGYILARFRPLVTRTEEQDTALFREIVRATPASPELDRLEKELNR